MAVFVLKNCKVLVGNYDLSGDMNSMTLSYESEVKDRTTFASGGARRKMSGLLDTKADWRGFWDAGVGKPDDVMFESIGLGDNVLTVCPVDGAVGEQAFFTKAVTGSYSPGAKVGELFEFSGNAEGNYVLVRGQVALNGVLAVTGNSASVNLGLVGAGQRVYAVMHVLAAAGTGDAKLVMRVQSDTSADFPSPIDRITFADVTPAAPTSQLLAAAGPIATDTWWRLQYTITGTNPSFNIAAAIAIQ